MYVSLGIIAEWLEICSLLSFIKFTYLDDILLRR